MIGTEWIKLRMCICFCEFNGDLIEEGHCIILIFLFNRAWWSGESIFIDDYENIVYDIVCVTLCEQSHMTASTLTWLFIDETGCIYM